MIIVSQDNNAFINIENIDSLQVIETGLRIKPFALITGDKSGSIILGEYTSHERGQEVINEIVSTYEEECIFAQLGITEDPINKTYRMPEN